MRSDLIDKEELRKRLGLKTIYAVDWLIRRKRIPFIKLGYRTIRFNWDRVEKTLSRRTTREIGA